jgi:phage/plasmid-like protein (TIGR03299 family)
MAHNLATNAAGQAMIAYRGETPWHKLGKRVGDAATGQEMLVAAGLDYRVDLVPVVAKGATDIDIPDMRASVRSDTNAVLGIVGDGYNVFQNHEMVSFFESLVKGRKIQYEVAGGLGKGEVVWVLAKIPDLTYAIKGDEMMSYMLIKNGHDGSCNLTVCPTSIRTVCMNTIKMASAEFAARRKLYGKSLHAGYKIRHTKGMQKSVEDAINAYDKCLTDAVANRQLLELLADKPVTDADVRAYFLKVMETADKAKASKIAEQRLEKRLDELWKIWNAPTNQTGTKGTAFAALNSVIEYVDFYRATRCTEGTTEEGQRFESAMFGSGDNLKSRATVEALELAGV